MPKPDLPPAISTPLSVRGVELLPTDNAQRLREKLARIVLDEMYQFVALLDTDGITLEVNRAALHGAGIRLDEIQGRPFWEARWWRVSPETQALQRDLIRRAAQGEFIRCDVEVYGEAAGEHTITIDYSLHPVRDQDGRIVFLLPEGRNITEKKRAEAEIQRLNQIKSDFFANVSHELRTPLALILGPLETLRQADNLTESQKRDVAVMQRNAGTLLKHVNDLLDLAKLDAGRTALEYTRIDLSRLVRDVAAHFDTLATQRGLDFTIDTPPALEIECDREKIERIVFNLLSNAFKFTPEGGRIQCTLSRRGNAAHLAVRDNGPGVPPALRADVFERFRQAQGGTTREFGGTGLGLAITKDFAELHGGAVSLDEAPGGGALFEVTLPLSAPAGIDVLPQAAPRADGAPALLAQAEPLASLPQPAPDGRPLVLVAEDNPDMLRFIAQLLGEDYRVACAADGAEALERALAEPPDLVVTDLMMPSLGGDRLVDAMRQEAALAHVPVLVLSAMADEGLRLRLLSSLVQDYLVKPFSAQELRIRVRNLMMMKRARDALQSELASQNEDLAQLAAQLVENRHELQDSLRALQESESRWRAVYDNSVVGIALSGLDTRILAANPACRRMLGYGEGELQGVSLMELTTEADRAETRASVGRLLSGAAREYKLEKRYERKDGSVLWASASVALAPGTRERPAMLIAVIEDISDRKRAEQALVQSQHELARVARVTAMGELVASIAHEVNQPLAAIVTNGQASLRWLAAAPPNLDEAAAAIGNVVRDANRAGDVIARIRGFIKRGDPHRTPVQVADVIADVVALVQAEIRSMDVILASDAAGGLPPVVADRVQLQQVLLNLVMNAAEALSTVGDRARRLAVSAAPLDGGVCVTVRDNGPGIDSARIFDAFYTTKPAGMGMGLSISRSIVEAHGGRLWAEANADGPGTAFHFTLPGER